MRVMPYGKTFNVEKNGPSCHCGATMEVTEPLSGAVIEKVAWCWNCGVLKVTINGETFHYIPLGRTFEPVVKEDGYEQHF